MKERRLVGKKTFSHSGVMDMNNLKKVIKDWCFRNDCKVDDSRSEEKVHGKEKQIYYEATVRRESADWLDIVFKINLDMRDMKEVEVELNGVKKRMWRVDAAVAVKGIIESDASQKWVGQPVLLFARHLIDKFIAKTEPAKAELYCKRGIDSLIDEIRAYLNLEKLSFE